MNSDERINQIAYSAVDMIIEDICDRRGLQNEWENIDNETQEEIKQAWTEIIQKAMKEGK